MNQYGDYGDIHLPKTPRVYFDAYCSEYRTYPVHMKLLDLAYVITHGFDVKKAVREILDSHSHISELAIYRAIKELTAAVNNVEYVSERQQNSLDIDIEIFIEDLMRRYRLPLDNSMHHYLDDNFRHVSEMDTYAANGWQLAAELINPRHLYTDDYRVGFPGDEEILRKYHQADIESENIGQIYLLGPCPEPWYGNPMIAKVIILGNMPHYDDFIVRCSDTVLSFQPRLMEVIRLMVKDWMSLSGSVIYDNHEFGQSGINVGDAYNSVTYRHWITELRNLAYQLEIDEQDFLNQVCVINANAYYAVGGADPLAAGILPSQYFLRVLVNYLVNNKNSDRPLFIIPSPRLHKVWKKVLGYWIENEVMLWSDPIIIKQPNTKLRLSADVLGKGNVKSLLSKLNIKKKNV